MFANGRILVACAVTIQLAMVIQITLAAQSGAADKHLQRLSVRARISYARRTVRNSCCTLKPRALPTPAPAAVDDSALQPDPVVATLADMWEFLETGSFPGPLHQLEKNVALLETLSTTMCNDCVDKCKQCISQGKNYSTTDKQCVKAGGVKDSAGCDALKNGSKHTAVQQASGASTTVSGTPDSDWNVEAMKIASTAEQTTASSVSTSPVGAVLTYKGKPLVWGRNDSGKAEHSASKPLHQAERNAIEQLILLCPKTYEKMWHLMVVFTTRQPDATCVEALLGKGDPDRAAFKAKMILDGAPQKVFYAKTATNAGTVYSGRQMTVAGSSAPAVPLSAEQKTEARLSDQASKQLFKDVLKSQDSASGGALVAECPMQ